MSNDKTASLDILAEAHLPADLLTPTLGSNYGMDGYPDMEYGMGVLSGVLDQDAQDAPALPTGVQKSAAAEMDLGGLMADESLADLDWLDPTQAPDPERLPESPEMIPELVEAWGVHHRTDGVHTAHQIDLAHARASEPAPKKKANARTIEKVVTHAMRRSVEGQHIERIVREAAESMGSEMRRVIPLLRRVAEDHGLAGNVFVRASAYPGWGTGKWKDHVKRHAKQAQYIIVSSDDLKQATWIQDGRCVYTGKKAVAEIPWKRAYAHYAPRLEATGRKVASGDLRRSLQAAFLSRPAKKTVETVFPVEKRAGHFEFGSSFRTQYDLDDRQVTHDKTATVGTVDWGSDANSARIRSAAEIAEASVSEEGVYAGSVFKAASLNTTASVTLSDENAAIAKAASDSGRTAGEIRNVLRTARRAMSEGLAGRDLTGYLTHRFADSILDASKSLVAGLRSAQEGLSGFVYVDAGAYASDAGVKGCESGAVKHRANQIPNVRAMDRCATCTLARVREDGTRKCGAYNKTLVSADDVAGPDFDQIKQANIRSTEMTDAEATASLFTPSYDPSEFNLVNANLESIELSTLPENEKVADIMFDGGWSID